jgi:hypothetical protein
MERQEVPRFIWKWGFTVSAENWNGRLAMLGFFFIVLIELFTGKVYKKCALEQMIRRKSLQKVCIGVDDPQKKSAKSLH